MEWTEYNSGEWDQALAVYTEFTKTVGTLPSGRFIEIVPTINGLFRVDTDMSDYSFTYHDNPLGEFVTIDDAKRSIVQELIVELKADLKALND